MKKELEELLNQNNIMDNRLKEILSHVKEKPVFLTEEKRLLSLEEILNYKNELKCNLDIIPLIDEYDNNFLVYNLKEKQFQILDISSDTIWKNIENIDQYLEILK